MGGVKKANLNRPDEAYEFDHGRAETVNLGDLTIGRGIVEPGWRWSKHIKPIVKTDWCQSRHLGFVVKGRMRVSTSDGEETDVGPGDFYDIPPGHDAWVLGDDPVETIEWSGMRGWISPLESFGERVLATVLFTDIVGSTQMAAVIGDRAWREVLAGHNDRMRQLIARFKGREVKTTGDGFLAVFDGAARALYCARQMAEAAASDGLKIRVGVHTGEVEWVDEDVRGLAVHEASRVLGLAGENEVILTSVTKELAVGAGLHFEDRGQHELKGLAGRQLFKLSS